MKRVLIVSPYFPPGNAPDMQRVRMSLPYYRANGWEPVVLAVGSDWQGCLLDDELLDTLPPEVRIVRTRAFSPRWTRRVGVGNMGLRAWPFFFWRGTRLLGRERFDLVFFSTSQHIAFTLGPIWKRWFGVPYVLDVQDPWRTGYYEREGARNPPGGWKYQFARFQAWLFEGWCFRNAAAIMSVSDRLIEDLRSRHPRLARTPGAALPFGASRNDFARAALKPGPGGTRPRGAGERHLVYTGVSGPVMSQALLVLFTGLRRYRERFPEKAGRLRLHFIGTSYGLPGQQRPSVLPIAEQCGTADLVEEILPRTGFLNSIRLQRDAGTLLLLGSNDPDYSPSKVFQYYLAERPILGLVLHGSIMEALLDRLSCAFLVRFRETGPGDDTCDELARAFDRILDDRLMAGLPPRNEAFFRENFLADESARRQCALFESAASAS
ncbi:MAG: glycosyltransferase [Opitutaceae bacterium]|jgi:hypothetical protein